MAESAGPQHGASLRQLARLIGVSEKAIRKAERAGVFAVSVVRDAAGAPSVTDLSVAVDEWERSGRQLRAGTRARGGPPAAAVPDGVPVAPALASEAAADLEELDEQEESDAAVSPSLVAAQIAAVLERGRKLRMENDLREGLLVEADRASREAFEFARVLREAILNIPARLSAELAAEADAGRIYLRLDVALREALERTANKLAETA